MSLPRTTPLPISYSSPPENWKFRPLKPLPVRSPKETIHCLEAEIATNEDQALVVILNVKYYTPKDAQDRLVKLVIGGTGVDTMVQPSDQGTVNLWGVVPSHNIQNESNITLQVLSRDEIYDSIEVGRLQIIDPCTKTESFEMDISDLPPSMDEIDELESTDTPPPDEDPQQEITPITDFLPPDYRPIQVNLEGNIESMIEDWSDQEVKAGRRLVCFEREQEAHIVRLRFHAQPPNTLLTRDKEPIISCIKWPDERHGYFVTSFDILKLSEFILNRSMGTELKNRARRNMAYINCETLPKVKSEVERQLTPLEEAFTHVMHFEDPKPRSIEKSIKIYDWSYLMKCINKILSRWGVCVPANAPSYLEFEHLREVEKKWRRTRKASLTSAEAALKKKKPYGFAPIRPAPQRKPRATRPKNTKHAPIAPTSGPPQLRLDTNIAPPKVSHDSPVPGAFIDSQPNGDVNNPPNSDNLGKNEPEHIATHSDQSSTMSSPTESETIASSILSPSSTHSDCSQGVELLAQRRVLIHPSLANPPSTARQNVERTVRPQFLSTYSAPVIQSSLATPPYSTHLTRSSEAISSAHVSPITTSLRDLSKDFPLFYCEPVPGQGVFLPGPLGSYPPLRHGNYLLHSVGAVMEHTLGIDNTMEIDTQVNDAEAEMDEIDTDEWLDIEYIKAQEEAAQDEPSQL